MIVVDIHSAALVIVFISVFALVVWVENRCGITSDRSKAHKEECEMVVACLLLLCFVFVLFLFCFFSFFFFLPRSHIDIGTDVGCKIRAWASSFEGVSSLSRVLTQHECTRCVEVISPSSSSIAFVAEALQAVQENYWRGDEYAVNLHLQPHFEECSVVCEGIDLNTDDCVQLSRSGTLVVQASRATHLRLGLDAQEVNRMWHSRVPRKDKSDRTEQALRRLPLFRCVAVSQSEPLQLPINWRSVRQEFSTRRVKIALPNLSFAPEVARSEMETALSWSGAALLGAAWPLAAAPEETPATEIGIASLRGMIASNALLRLVDLLRVQKEASPPWTMIVIRGFDEDIEADGERNMVVVIKPGGKDYWAFVAAKNLNKIRVC
jgi:hypothetical protein